MIRILSRCRPVLCLFLAATIAAAADSIERFGLRHTTIGQAVFENSDYALQVIGLSTNGTDGLSSELGAPDSGVFIYPNTRQVDWGYSMTARVFGSVNGESNRPIGTVYGYRADYAQFYAGADYSPIGATNLTFQLWRGFALVAETTITNGEVFMYGEYAQPPRVNPWWQRDNGGYGTSIEFTYPIPVILPSGSGDINGDRIFIRPNGATGTVDHISRTDVFGGGGVENFSYTQVRLGMFGHPHISLNDAKFDARPGALTLDQIVPGEEEGGGVAVELQPSTRAVVNLLPLEIAVPNTNDTRHRLELSATGSRDSYSTYIGSLFLANSNGVLEFTPYIYDEEIATVDVFSNNVLMGSSVVQRPSSLRIDGAPRVTSFEATADTLASPASLGLSFDTNATITLTNGTQLTGNRIVVRTSQWYRFADISSMVIFAHEVPSFTIVSEPAEPFGPPRLEIARSGTNVVLQWVDPAQAYKVELSTELVNSFVDAELQPSYTNGIAIVELTPIYDTAFFRLRRYVNPIND